MPPSASQYSVQPIGVARTAVADDQVSRQRRHMVSEIEVYEAFQEGLLGLEEYSHLIVVFLMHQAPINPTLQAHPRGNATTPKSGVFAARGRNHPNRIGLAVVELLDVAEGVLTVRKLDAYDGTPIIDIKPYDHYDIVAEPRVPAWFRRKLKK